MWGLGKHSDLSARCHLLYTTLTCCGPLHVPDLRPPEEGYVYA